MLYYSSRSKQETCTAAQAIVKGLASDGGLFIPAKIPVVDEDFIQQLLPLKLGQMQQLDQIFALHIRLKFIICPSSSTFRHNLPHSVV